MEIPYTVEARPDTGLTNGKIGIWLFLASEVMLFGALFATYIMLRVGHPEWPLGASILNVPMATLNTVVLITSSVTMVMAWASLARQRFGVYRMYMWATPGDLLHADRAACPARLRRDVLHRLLRRAGRQAVENGQAVADESRREHGPVLALRGSGLDLPVPDPLSAVGESV
jgi:hypothetical protein